jgi:uncharacterized protein (TIGR02246 family)
MGSDERAIHEVHTTWIDAVNAGDLARLLTLMADDVEMVIDRLLAEKTRISAGMPRR